MARFKHGDIFAVQLPNQQYLFGRILLNVKEQCVKPKLLEPGSPFIKCQQSWATISPGSMVSQHIYRTTSLLMGKGLPTDLFRLCQRP